MSQRRYSFSRWDRTQLGGKLLSTEVRAYVGFCPRGLGTFKGLTDKRGGQVVSRRALEH